MNRLTKRAKDGLAYSDIPLNQSSVLDANENIVECYTGFIAERLAAYEDTGLEPEQIDELNKMLLNDQIRHGRALDKLLEYQKLEKQELLIELPCKVGDTVWYHQEQYQGKTITKPCAISAIQIDRWIRIYGIEERQNSQMFYVDDFGKTVFLTREEAEKALEASNVE